MSYNTLNDGVRLARSRTDFKAAKGTVFGKWWGDQVYVVYSYGYHFPMYVYDTATGKWYGNSDKYGVTTSKHQGKYRPVEVKEYFDTDTLSSIIAADGLINWLAAKAKHAA